MLLRSLCPNCGTKKEYIAEQVGQSSHCEKCGNAFILKANDGRVAWQIVAATLVVLFIIGGLLLAPPGAPIDLAWARAVPQPATTGTRSMMTTTNVDMSGGVHPRRNARRG